MNSDLIKGIRQYKNVSQESFAEWLGVSTSAIALIEAGHRSVSDNLASKIAHRFDVKNVDFIEYLKRKEQTSAYFFKTGN